MKTLLVLALPLVVLGCNREAPATDSTSSPPASQTPGARGEGERERTPAETLGAGGTGARTGARIGTGMSMGTGLTTSERMDSGDVRTTGTQVAAPDAGPAPMDAGIPKPRP